MNVVANKQKHATHLRFYTHVKAGINDLVQQLH